ncbi:MAG: hypothetical protein A3A58_01595 [Candidatus Blackburnbacteria bacterium RIFCSPLOWO2_01_FULL_41_27]|uniref:Sec-independent protein translocase protein TatA n=2 Tax=Candidatus Blackburniibacteriota TaxID=1817898 RepID=A0A1G1V626_9BACT|nr:MAG: hypothetical protein A3F61_02300 [Candidatus Blackburnbacteria bacterium RIFCSPHIGHO2_12_FULL_41_13b]OGY14341.1 MAG: hypothetical protein A3A58_01595 [Candidatus Blackburnbacteria bacterium RIFCSPLOWO2_01_FULL_41_27]
MLKNIGPLEILIIGIVLILLFGSKKIIDLARDLGTGTKELKKAKSEYEKASNEQVPEKNVKTEDKEVNILV